MAPITRPVTPALLVGRTRHRRHAPKTHAFSLATYSALVNIDEVAALADTVRGFSVNRFNVTGLATRDHLGPGDAPFREKLATLLATHGVALPDGDVLLLTNLKNFGYVFDPVSWWFCYDRTDTLVYIVVEVHNTFGEQHAYLLDTFTTTASGQLKATATKVFHVSPFLAVSPLTYTFTFRIDAHALAVHIDVADDTGRIFDATQYGTLVGFTTRTLLHAFVTHPLMALRTVWRIHREALALFAKRIPFHRKPEPPVKELT